MSLHLPETGIALLLAAAFALLGDLLLWRRSRNLYRWTESFLIGAAVAASLLFPLSLLTPRRSLALLAGLLAAAAGTALILRLLAPGSRASPSVEQTSGPRENRDALAIAFACATALGGLVFVVLNWRLSHLWDGFQIWAARAQLLFHEGGIVRTLDPNDYVTRALLRPPLIPTYEALLSLLRGRFDFNVVKPVFLPFYVAMVIATHRAARAVASRRLALAATAILCLLPAVSTGFAAGGYADMPQAAYVAAVAAAYLTKGEERGWRSPTPWLIGSLTAVKDEGMILAAICCLVAVLIAVRGRFGGLRQRLSLTSMAPVALLIGLRMVYLRWVGIPDANYLPVNLQTTLQGIDRLPDVLRLCSADALAFRNWGFFWSAFLLAGILLLFTRSAPAAARTVAGAALLAVAAYSAIFLYTAWPLALHIEQAYDRLLEQIAPAAALVIVLGYRFVGAKAVSGEKA